MKGLTLGQSLMVTPTTGVLLYANGNFPFITYYGSALLLFIHNLHCLQTLSALLAIGVCEVSYTYVLGCLRYQEKHVKDICCCLQTCNSVVYVVVMGLVLGQSLMVISNAGILLYAKVSPLYNVLWECIFVVYT